MANRFTSQPQPPHSMQPGEGAGANLGQTFFYHPGGTPPQQAYANFPAGTQALPILSQHPQPQQYLQHFTELQRRQQQQQQQQQQQEAHARTASGMPPPPQVHPGYARLPVNDLAMLQQQQQQQQQAQAQQERELRQKFGLPEGTSLSSYAANYAANQKRQQQQQQLQYHHHQQQQQQLMTMMAAGKAGGGATAQPVAGVMMMPQQQQQQLPGTVAGVPHVDPAIAAASPVMPMPGGGNSAAPAASPTGASVAGNSSAAAGASGATAAAPGKNTLEVNDEYGLKQLVKVMQAPLPMSTTPYVPSPNEPTDPQTGRPISQQEADELNFSFITHGVDITQIGLSVTEEGWLHTTLATLPLDSYEHYILPEFKIPDCYKKPRPKSLSMKSFHQFKEGTLFYIFYSMPRDVLHLAAARALYEHEWRYHKRAQYWFRPAKGDDGAPLETVTTGPDGQKAFTGTYIVFQPNEWKQVRTQSNHIIAAADVEEVSMLVAAMEEAARQQSQRTRVKAAHTTSSGSGSPGR